MALNHNIFGYLFDFPPADWTRSFLLVELFSTRVTAHLMGDFPMNKARVLRPDATKGAKHGLKGFTVCLHRFFPSHRLKILLLVVRTARFAAGFVATL